MNLLHIPSLSEFFASLSMPFINFTSNTILDRAAMTHPKSHCLGSYPPAYLYSPCQYQLVR